MKKYDIDKIIEKIEKYKDMDLNDINPDDIPDINEIRIDRRKPKVERMLDFLSQVENPYVFKVNGHLVQIGFTNNGKTVKDCLEIYFDISFINPILFSVPVSSNI